MKGAAHHRRRSGASRRRIRLTFPKEDPLADFPDHLVDEIVEQFDGSRMHGRGEAFGVEGRESLTPARALWESFELRH